MSRSPSTSELKALLSFKPIPRKNVMATGWTPERQRNLILGIARTGSVRVACESVGMSYANVHKLRQNPGAESFNAAWDKAVGMAASRVREVLIDHSVNGVPVPLTSGGKLIGETRRFNHRTMMWVLQHHMPEDYGVGERKDGAFARRHGYGPPDDPAKIRAEMMGWLAKWAKRLGTEVPR